MYINLFKRQWCYKIYLWVVFFVAAFMNHSSWYPFLDYSAVHVPSNKVGSTRLRRTLPVQPSLSMKNRWNIMTWITLEETSVLLSHTEMTWIVYKTWRDFLEDTSEIIKIIKKNLSDSLVENSITPCSLFLWSIEKFDGHFLHNHMHQ